MTGHLPQAAAHLAAFASLLRSNGFVVSADQTHSFLAAVGILGPRSMQDIHMSAVAVFAPVMERRETFDGLYRSHFLGQALPDAGTSGSEDNVEAFDSRDGSMDPPEANEQDESGADASGAENLSLKMFDSAAADQALIALRRRGAASLPLRKSRRRRIARSGRTPDLRRVLRESVKRDGEALHVPRLKRKMRQRRLLLLIDVSGSMKQHTESYMRFAHALASAAHQIEVFTLGTRLTRVTRALRLKNAGQALAVVATLVSDWDGGTRLGEALGTFLSVPRFAGFARGSLVVILSDGLERGGHDVLTQTMERMQRLSWSILWLTPLASTAGFAPETMALQAVSKHVTRFGRGHSIPALCEDVLGFARMAA